MYVDKEEGSAINHGTRRSWQLCTLIVRCRLKCVKEFLVFHYRQPQSLQECILKDDMHDTNVLPVICQIFPSQATAYRNINRLIGFLCVVIKCTDYNYYVGMFTDNQ